VRCVQATEARSHDYYAMRSLICRLMRRLVHSLADQGPTL
jgi:hypothetical protein